MDFNESEHVRFAQLTRLNQVTEGNRIHIIMKDGSSYNGFDFQVQEDSCRFMAGDKNRFWQLTVPTASIDRIETSSKIKGSGIVMGTVLAGLTFLAFKDNPNLNSGDYFILVGGSFLVGTVVGESFEIFSIDKKSEIRFMSSFDSMSNE
jgi:hypothetical protein